VAARIVTDGGFRPDGTFVRWPGWPAHDSGALSEAFRRAAALAVRGSPVHMLRGNHSERGSRSG